MCPEVGSESSCSHFVVFWKKNFRSERGFHKLSWGLLPQRVSLESEAAFPGLGVQPVSWMERMQDQGRWVRAALVTVFPESFLRFFYLEGTLELFRFFFSSSFWLSCLLCRILIPQPGIAPGHGRECTACLSWITWEFSNYFTEGASLFHWGN